MVAGYSLFLLFSCLLSLSYGATNLQILSDLHKRSSTGVIYLNGDTFDQFLLSKRPVPYTVVVLFSIGANCEICPTVEQSFANLAASYKDQLPADATPVFFAVMYYQQSTHRVFQRYSIRTVPILMVSKEQLDSTKLPSMDTWYFSASGAIDEDRMMDYVNKRTQQKVILKKGMLEVIGKTLVPLLLFGSILYLLIRFRWILMNPISWLVIACAVFLICCGGIVHNILHRVPIAGMTRGPGGEVEYEYISTGQREQYGLEGYIASFLMLLTGGSFVAVYFILNIFKSGNRRTHGYIMVALSFLALWGLMSMYKIKAPWYSPTFAPPNDYVKGPLSNDQGNSI